MILYCFCVQEYHTRLFMDAQLTKELERDYASELGYYLGEYQNYNFKLIYNVYLYKHKHQENFAIGLLVCELLYIGLGLFFNGSTTTHLFYYLVLLHFVILSGLFFYKNKIKKGGKEILDDYPILSSKILFLLLSLNYININYIKVIDNIWTLPFTIEITFFEIIALLIVIFINITIDKKQKPLSYSNYYRDYLLSENLRKNKSYYIKLFIIIILIVGSFFQLGWDFRNKWVELNIMLLFLILQSYITTLKSVNIHKMLSLFLIEHNEINPERIFTIQDYDPNFMVKFKMGYLSTLKINLDSFDSKNKIKIDRSYD